jgi:hypothetical protein
MNRRRFFVVSAGMTLAAGLVRERVASAGSSSELVVVVNRESGPTAISPLDLKRIFLTRMRRFDGGAVTEPANLPLGTSERSLFDRSVLQMEPEEVRLYWIDRKVRGGAPPPPRIPSPSLLLRHVAQHKGGIGYVTAGDVDDSVRIIARVRDGKVVSS